MGGLYTHTHTQTGKKNYFLHVYSTGDVTSIGVAEAGHLSALHSIKSTEPPPPSVPQLHIVNLGGRASQNTTPWAKSPHYGATKRNNGEEYTAACPPDAGMRVELRDLSGETRFN